MGSSCFRSLRRGLGTTVGIFLSRCGSSGGTCRSCRGLRSWSIRCAILVILSVRRGRTVGIAVIRCVSTPIIDCRITVIRFLSRGRIRVIRLGIIRVRTVVISVGRLSSRVANVVRIRSSPLSTVMILFRSRVISCGSVVSSVGVSRSSVCSSRGAIRSRGRSRFGSGGSTFR